MVCTPTTFAEEISLLGQMFPHKRHIAFDVNLWYCHSALLLTVHLKIGQG